MKISLKYSLIVAWMALSFLIAAKLYLGPLSIADRWFIFQNPVVKVGVELNYPPYMYVDEAGDARGFSLEYLRLIEHSTGIKFDFTTKGHLHELLPKLAAGEIAIVTSLKDTPERRAYASFTQPYAYVGAVMVTKTTTSTVKKVAVGKGCALEKWLRDNRKDLQVVAFENDDAGIKAMMAGEVDAAALDEASFSFLWARNGLPKVDTVNLPFSYPLAFAVTKKQERLHSIMSRAVAAIPTNARRALVEQLSQ